MSTTTTTTALYDFDTHLTALALATISGVSTGLGGFVVLLFGTPSDRAVGRMLGFASGVMLFVSFAHLVPESVEVVGAAWCAAAFLCGMAVFHATVRLLPDPDPARFFHNEQQQQDEQRDEQQDEQRGDVVDDKSDGSGSGDDCRGVGYGRGRARASAAGSSSSSSSNDSSSSSSSTSTSTGGSGGNRGGGGADRRQLLMTSLVVVTGIALHNLPEGMAVYLSTLRGWRLGAAIALAIACHNVPEGMAVATTMYAATRSRRQSVKWAFLSGLAEPLGALAFGLFFHRVVTEWAVFAMLAAVAGVMTHICATELAPGAYRATQSLKDTLLAHVLGMAVLFGCSLALDLV